MRALLVGCALAIFDLFEAFDDTPAQPVDTKSMAEEMDKVRQAMQLNWAGSWYAVQKGEVSQETCELKLSHRLISSTLSYLRRIS